MSKKFFIPQSLEKKISDSGQGPPVDLVRTQSESGGFNLPVNRYLPSLKSTCSDYGQSKSASPSMFSMNQTENPLPTGLASPKNLPVEIIPIRPQVYDYHKAQVIEPQYTSAESYMTKNIAPTEENPFYAKENVFSKIQFPVWTQDFYQFQVENYRTDVSVDDQVLTISPFWIPIEVMQGFGNFNPVFKSNIKKLHTEKRVIGWKKSRGDGNCYFRAVATRYVEIIHKFYNPLSYIRTFGDIIERTLKKIEGIEIPQEFLYAAHEILVFLGHTSKNKVLDPINTFLYVLKQFEDPTFDLNLVRLARLITYATFLNNYQNEEFQSFMIDNQSTVNSIMTMGEEAEGLTLLFLPLGLGCQVVQFNVFQEINVQEYPNAKSNITIHIVRRAGHYDILYTIQEMEIEQFDFLKGTYNFCLTLQETL